MSQQRTKRELNTRRCIKLMVQNSNKSPPKQNLSIRYQIERIQIYCSKFFTSPSVSILFYFRKMQRRKCLMSHKASKALAHLSALTNSIPSIQSTKHFITDKTLLPRRLSTQSFQLSAFSFQT